MGNSAFGYKNVFPRGQIAAGSEENLLAANRLGGKLGSFASGWQTKLGVVQPKMGSWFTVDALTEQSWRVFLLTRTNLTSGARVRWRVGGSGLLVPMKPLVDIDFSADPFVPPATGTWSFSRTSPAWRCRADGVWEEVPAHAVVTHWDPWTGQNRGWLPVLATTNRIRNPRGEGLVYPSTPPTYWDSVVGASLTLEWLQQTSLDGLPGAYAHVFGTTGASAESVRIYFETASAIAATQNQRCPQSCFHLFTGDTTGISCSIGYEELTNTGTLLADRATAQTSMVPVQGLNTGRAGQGYRGHSLVNTNPSSTLTNIRPYFQVNVAAGTTCDFILFLGGATQETNVSGPGTPTPVYPPVGSPAAQARSSDSASYTPPSGTFGALHLGGTAYVEYAPTYIINGNQAGNSVLQLDGGSNAERILLRGGTVAMRGRFNMAVVTGNVVVFEGNTSGSHNAAASMTAQTSGKDRPYIIAATWDGAGAISAANYQGYGTAALMSASWSGAMPTSLTRMVYTLATASHQGILRWRVYGEKVSPDRLLGLILEGVPLDTTGVSYDSGWVDAGVAPGIGQTTHLPTTVVSARYLRCDIDDPANPDGFINIPLAYAGDLWQPTHGIDWSSSSETRVSEQVLESRAGQEYVEPLFRQRVGNLSLSAIREDEVWLYQQELDRVAASGENVLFLPDRTSAYVNSEAILGVLKSQAPLAYSSKSTKYRNWRARLSERL